MRQEGDQKTGEARRWLHGCFSRVPVHLLDRRAWPETEETGDVTLPDGDDVVQAGLRLVCGSRGAGFATVAQARDGAWIACAVHDGIGFGLRPGEAFVIEASSPAPGRGSVEQGLVRGDLSVTIDHLVEYRCPAGRGDGSADDCGHFFSAPIPRAVGGLFGILCVVRQRQPCADPDLLDTFPDTLEQFGRLLGFHLDADERKSATDDALLLEREVSRMHEQFIAMLGHDLRNPLGAIDSGVSLLEDVPAHRRPAVFDVIRRSVDRMTGMIDTLADLARVRLGQGLSLQRDPDLPLWPMLEQIVSEQRMAWPGRVIESSIARDAGIDCDRHRIAQLLSNLLGNALAHGAVDAPVRVDCALDAGALSIVVENHGEPIPPAMLDRIFLPFTGRPARPGSQGLGLGLYICAEIARAHGGTLEVDSTPARTCFSFCLPLTRATPSSQAARSASGRRDSASTAGTALARWTPDRIAFSDAVRMSASRPTPKQVSSSSIFSSR